MGDIVRDVKFQNMETICVTNSDGEKEEIDVVDVCVTEFSDRPGLAVALVNKLETEYAAVQLDFEAAGEMKGYYICGESVSSYNDIGRTQVVIQQEQIGTFRRGIEVRLRPHSVEIIQIGCRK